MQKKEMEIQNGKVNGMETTSKLFGSLDFFKTTALKIFPLVGYSNGNTDYKTAKTPAVKWKNSPGLSLQDAQTWIEQKGWVGLVIPPGFILIDVDDQNTGETLYRAFQDEGLHCISIKTPNGYQFLFHDIGRVKYQAAKMLTIGGLVVDYRLSGSGYTVLPTENTEGREVIHIPEEELDPMPLMFISARRFKDKDTPLIIPIGEGCRNDVLFRDVTSRMQGLNQAHRLGLTEQDRLGVVVEINRFFCDPSLPYREVESLFRSAERYIEEPIEEEQPENLLDSLMRWNDFYDLNITTEYLLEGLIPKGGITLLFSRGGLGKTSLMLQVCQAIAEGIPFGELQTIRTPVYYIDFENPLTFLKERIEKIGKTDNLYVWHISNSPMPPRLDSKEWELYKKLPPGLAVIDTLRAGHLLDENNSKDMALIVSRLKELREIGFTVLLLHHTPKGNEGIYKGSTAILDLADHVLGLEILKETDDDVEFDPNKTYRLSTRIKTRYEPHSIYLTFNPEIKGFELAKDPDIEKMEEVAGILKGIKEPIKQKDLIEKIKDECDYPTGEIRKVLRKGTDVYWTVTKGEKNAMLYSVIQFSTLYIGQKTEKQEITSLETPKNTPYIDTPETPVSGELFSSLKGSQKTKKQDFDKDFPPEIEDDLPKAEKWGF